MVNSIKLTKLERRVLKALFEKRVAEYGNYPNEGNNVEGITKIVYGDRALNCEKAGGHYVSDVSVCYSAKSSLSRTLKSLWMKGMVKKCHPRYRRYWHKPNEWNRERVGGGFYGADLMGLDASWINEEGISYTNYIRASGFSQLPHRTRVWWILTDKGKDVVEEITGRNKLRDRCRTKCESWDEDRDQCSIERIGKKALTLENCSEEGVWHWVEHEGWVTRDQVIVEL